MTIGLMLARMLLLSDCRFFLAMVSSGIDNVFLRRMRQRHSCSKLTRVHAAAVQ